MKDVERGVGVFLVALLLVAALLFIKECRSGKGPKIKEWAEVKYEPNGETTRGVRTTTMSSDTVDFSEYTRHELIVGATVTVDNIVYVPR